MSPSRDALEVRLRNALHDAAETVPPDAGQRQLERLDVAEVSAQPAERLPSQHRWRAPAAMLLVAAAVLLVVALPYVLHQPGTPSETGHAARANEAVDGIEGVTLQGRQVDAADYRGAPLLVTAWGSWCQPCTRQLSSVQDLQSQTDIRVLGIAVRDRRESAVALEERLGLPFESIEDETGAISAHFPGPEHGYPMTWLLDGEGRVLMTWNGVVADWAPVREAAAGSPPIGNSLGDHDLNDAVAVARQEADRLRIEPTNASVTFGEGTIPDSNTGHPCTSGRLMHIKLIGDFDTIPHSSAPGVPYEPTSAVRITADPESGKACLIGVSTGTQSPPAGSVQIFIE